MAPVLQAPAFDLTEELAWWGSTCLVPVQVRNDWDPVVTRVCGLVDYSLTGFSWITLSRRDW